MLFVAILTTLVYMAGAYDRLSNDMDVWLLLLKIAAICIFLAAVGASIYDLITGWSQRRNWFGKLASIVIAASCTLLLWIAVVFNLANFSNNY